MRPHLIVQKKQIVVDSLKEIEFKKKGGNIVMCHKGQELAIYFNKLKFEYTEKFFKTIIPKWKMEKVIYQDLSVTKLNISKNLPHQCKCREVCDGRELLYHIQIQYGRICPAGTLINTWTQRFWLIWYDVRNFVRFINTKGIQNYIKADPPWTKDES